MPGREAPLLVLGPFNGLDATTDPRKLDPSKGTTASNLSLNRQFGSYASALGRSMPFGSTLPNTPTSLFTGNVGTSSGSVAQYFAFVNNSGTKQMYESSGGAAWSLLTTNLGGLNNATSNFGDAINYDGRVFFNVNPPCQIDTAVIVGLVEWQVTAPPSAPTVAAGAAGSLNGVYQYAVTFGTRGGQESSPSPISSPVTLTSQKGSLTAIPTSTQNDVTNRNIYRTGGTLGEAFFNVGNINDNTTTTFTDNTADVAVTGAEMILHRDPPASSGFAYVELHKDRAWGFNSYTQGASLTRPTSDLWYSNYQAPWEWDTVNGILAVEGSTAVGASGWPTGDYGVGLASIGSVLVCLKSKSLWIVEGNTPDDPFVPLKIADIGCLSSGSIAKGDGSVYWMSGDGVYQFDGSSPQYVSNDIRGFLRTLGHNDLHSTVGWYQDHQYYVSFPNQTITYVYDVIAKSWTTRPWYTTCASHDNNPQLGGLSGAPTTGIAIIADTSVAGNVDLVAAADTDFGGNVNASFVSKIENNGTPWMTKRYRSVSVTAPIQSNSATVIITANPGAPSQQQTTLTFDLSQGPTQKKSLPPFMLGAEVQVEVDTATTTAATIDAVSVNGWEEREMISVG